MGKLASWLLMFVVLGGVAHAGGKKHGDKLGRWEAVMALQPGTEIDVLAGNQAGAEPCLVSTVDDGALTCLREDPANDTRLVFPRSAVREVRVWAVAPDRHIGLWIGAVISIGLEAWACVAGGGAGCMVMGLVIGVAWLAVESPAPWPMWAPPPLPRMPLYHWRLMYRAPAAESVSP